MRSTREAGIQVIHVVPSIEEEAAGPAYSVIRLCDALQEAGVEVRLGVVAQGASRVSRSYLRTFPPGAGPARLGISPSLRRWLNDEAMRGLDVIHNHSLWMMPNVYPRRAAALGGAKLVVSPRGTLSAWALGRSAFRKKIFWHLLQRRALASADCFHATAESEFLDIRRMGFPQPVCILPNGVDIPPEASTPRPVRRRLLFLGRIHPVKGVDVLLQSWARLEARFPDWDLHILGPDNGGHLAAMQTLSARLNLERVQFGGAVFGPAKLRAYQEASLYVLPSHSENFGMTVAEALAAGTPALVTQGTPWKGLEAHGAGWWIEHGVESMTAALDTALALPRPRLEEMGRAGRAWMIQDYSWERIGAQMMDVYRWLLGKGATPPWVRVD
jgi:glycosyltransferase involved in cell wall biosynthesis